MEAQRFPADYDGIIAGAPAANFTRILSDFVSNLLATTVDSASYIPANKFPAIEAAVLAACDARDGLRDGLIDEPNRCRFDPSVLLCKSSDAATCLTPPQIAALRKIYAGLRSSKGEELYPGFVPGGESGPGGWGLWIAGPGPDKSLQYGFGTQGVGNIVFQSAAYDYKTFNVDRDVKAADDLVGRTLNAIDPNLSAFQKRGGKLILFHGWSDAALPPVATVDYFRSVSAKLGAKTTDSFARLYMVPGMQHCSGGPGPDMFGAFGTTADADPSRNMSAALERWVAQGVAPSTIVASKLKPGQPGGVAYTRPLCPYPQVAAYKGSGDSNDAANFSCINR
jgi:feruloyl esterase